MEYRRLTPDENRESGRIMGQAFQNEHFCNLPFGEGAEALEMSRRLYGAFDESGVMAATVSIPLHTVRYFDADVPLAAVGGVACLPAWRRGGVMRGLLTYALEDARGRGGKLAALYPFSHPFYRKFGFEACCRAWNVWVSMNALRALGDTGRAVQFLPGMDAAPLRRIWAAFVEKINLACVRDEARMWKALTESDPCLTRRYTYLWQAERDEAPRAYVSFVPVREENEPGYQVKDMAWTDTAALRGVLGFLCRMSPQGNFVRLFLPEGVDPFRLVEEPYEARTVMHTAGMARVLDGRWCMERRPFSAEEQVCIRVSGDVLDGNNGLWRLTTGEKVTFETAPAGVEADAEMSIQAFSALCLGAATPQSWLRARTDGLRITRREAAFERLFTRCDVQLTEAF